LPDVAVAEAVERVLAAADGLQEGRVLGSQRVQGPHRCALPLPPPPQLLGQLGQRRRLFHIGQPRHIAFVDLLVDLRPAVQVGHPLTQPAVVLRPPPCPSRLRYTLKCRRSFNCDSTRSTWPNLSYIFTEFPETKCLTRVPSTNSLTVVRISSTNLTGGRPSC